MNFVVIYPGSCGEQVVDFVQSMLVFVPPLKYVVSLNLTISSTLLIDFNQVSIDAVVVASVVQHSGMAAMSYEIPLSIRGHRWVGRNKCFSYSTKSSDIFAHFLPE